MTIIFQERMKEKERKRERDEGDMQFGKLKVQTLTQFLLARKLSRADLNETVGAAMILPGR